MKKTLLFVFILISSYSQAQLEVVKWNFNEANAIEGWQLIDNDGNGKTFNVKNNEYNLSMGSGEAFNVLGTDDLGGGTIVRDNWAVLPVQDLSFYTGVKLNFNYLNGSYEAENNDIKVRVYALASATQPTVAEILATGTLLSIVSLEGDYVNDPPIAVTKTVDAPAALNVANVYMALNIKWESGPAGSFALEFKDVSITAEDVVTGIDDITADSRSVIAKNPVGENLQIRLSEAATADSTLVSIYNVSGVLVKQVKYNEEGMNVENLASGFYLVVLSDNQRTEKLKFIKK